MKKRGDQIKPGDVVKCTGARFLVLNTEKIKADRVALYNCWAEQIIVETTRFYEVW